MARLKRSKRSSSSQLFSVPSSGHLPPNSVFGSIAGYCDHCSEFHSKMEQSFLCVGCLQFATTNRFLKVDGVYLGVVACSNCNRIFYPFVESLPRGFKFIPDQ